MKKALGIAIGFGLAALAGSAIIAAPAGPPAGNPILNTSVYQRGAQMNIDTATIRSASISTVTNTPSLTAGVRINGALYNSTGVDTPNQPVWANPLDYGARCNGSYDDSSAIQRAINASSYVQFPPGTCIATDLKFNTNLGNGWNIRGASRGSRGTIIKNDGASPLFASTGTSTFAYFHFSDFTLEQNSVGAGDLIHIENSFVHGTIENIEFTLINPASHFYFGSPKTNASIKIRNIRGTMASAAIVPAFKMITSAGESIFTNDFADMFLNSHANVTAPIFYLDNRDGGIGGYTTFERVIFEVPGGGAVEARSLGNLTFIGCDVADLDPPGPSQAMMLFGKSPFNTLPATDVTFIGSVLTGGSTTHPDIEIESYPTDSQGSLVLINTRASIVKSPDQPIIDIGGIYGRTLMGGTTIFAMNADARITGVRGISATNTRATNLRGSVTFTGSQTKTVTFPTAEPDNSYYIFVTSDKYTESFAVVDKFTTQFTIASSSPTSTAAVQWLLVR